MKTSKIVTALLAGSALCIAAPAAVPVALRRVDPGDGRVVRLQLTPTGLRRLEALAAAHLEEIEGPGPHLGPVRDALGGRAKLRG